MFGLPPIRKIKQLKSIVTSRERADSGTDVKLAQFVATPETRSAYQAVRRIAAAVRAGQSPRDALPLFLHGPPGVGKSHLAAGLVAAVSEGSPARTAQLIPAADLPGDLPEAVSSDVVRGALECDVLAIEDVQQLPARAAGIFSSIVDFRVDRRKPLVVTAGVGPALLPALPQRLTSRLSAGLVIALNLPSPASRRYLLERLAQRQRVPIAPGVLDWLAAQSSGGVRPLLGSLTTLHRLSDGSAKPLELAAVQKAWPNPVRESRGADLDRVARSVANYYSLEVAALRSRKRQAGTLWPLQVAMFLARELTALPWTRIGVAFGGRDPSTVRHAARKVAERAATDPATATALRQLRSELC